MTFLSILAVTISLWIGIGVPPSADTGKSGADEPAKACCPSESKPSAAKTPTIDTNLYTQAAWPTHNTGKSLYAKNFQGQKLPVSLGNETWISPKTDLSSKVVILDFWATWCGPCRTATPMLAQLQEDHRENLAVVAISGQGEDEATVRSYLKKHKDSIHNLFDADQSVYSPFESKYIPLVVVMSTDGVIRWIGNPHQDEFKAVVEQVIQADPLIQAKD